MVFILTIVEIIKTISSRFSGIKNIIASKIVGRIFCFNQYIRGKLISEYAKPKHY